MTSILADVLRTSLPPEVGGLHVNYRYMLAWSMAFSARMANAAILDFGCGDGSVVRAGRSLGLDLHGTDVLDESDVVRQSRDGKIPFESGRFDFILSNQVIEHVELLEPTLREISRVLRKDGLFVCLFPTREVLREAHCGVPFLHWLPKGAAFRIPYAKLWHGVGFSFYKEKVSRRQWATDAVEWMDRFVFYRPRAEVLSAFRRVFRIESIEEHYLAYRLPRFAAALRVPWVRDGARFVCRRLNGTVLVARKRVP